MQRQALLFSGVLALTSACIVVKPGVLDAGDGADDDYGEDDEGEPIDTGSEPDVPEPDPNPDDGHACTDKLDILVVIDNSGSMGEEQSLLTTAFPLLINGLDQAQVDWRLAVTTTDNGNMWCQGTTPEHGSFVFSSCKDRLDDFMFGIDVDMRDLACNDLCSLDPQDVEALPTTTADDPNPKQRPWLQREGGQLNLPFGVEAAEAVRCLLPQGINGCGFEQPLESMRQALLHMTDPMAPEAGFMRDDASLLVVMVTDELDCSVRPEFEEAVFDHNGDRVFWSDPNDNFPTSAVCWNAGVECTGDPSNYDDCVSANNNLLGLPSGPQQAVVYPVSRYVNALAAIEQSKRALDPSLDVAVLSLVGVETDGTITYVGGNPNDPFVRDFGISPGCTRANPLDPKNPIAAVPPVRIREVAEQLSSDPLRSICESGFEDFMLDAVERLVGGC